MNAVLKAEAVAEGRSGDIVIGADTLVTYGDLVMGKPKDEEEAKNLLRGFSANEISVYTGLCVIDTENAVKASGTEKSSITVRELKESDVNRYFSLLGPYDKAGGFSIEGVGALLFDDIKGSYFNILGLSLMALERLLAKTDIDILDLVSRKRP